MVDSVKPGEDGHVRTVNIRYTNPGKTPEERSPPKITMRPIHKVAVIVPVGYVFEDDHRAEPGGVEPPEPAEASAPEEVTLVQPDPAGDGSVQPGPVEAANADDAHQAQGEASGGAAGGPEPIVTRKKRTGRPKKEVRADADQGVAPVADNQSMGDRPRRKAAIRAEENLRRGGNKGPEAWPLLQARANRGRFHQGN